MQGYARGRPRLGLVVRLSFARAGHQLAVDGAQRGSGNRQSGPEAGRELGDPVAPVPGAQPPGAVEQAHAVQ